MARYTLEKRCRMKKLLIALAITSQLLVSTNLVIAQEIAKNKILTIKDWSGGLATKFDDASTPSKFARIAENLRLGIDLKAITKRSQLFLFGTADATEPITSLHRFYMKNLTKVLLATHGDEIETANDTTGVFAPILALTTPDYRWKWLTWHDLAIGTDGYNQPVKYNGTVATYLGTCSGVDSGANAGNGPVAGTYSYKVSFYTATYEVIFNVASAPVVNGVGNDDISLTQIPIGPDSYLGEAVVGRKIYRNKLADQTHWFLLSAASGGTMVGNSVTILTDTDTDAELTVTGYPAVGATVAQWTPPKGKLSIIHKNRLWIFNSPTYPSRGYYSKDGSHELFETATNYFDIRQNDGDEVTFVSNLLGILTVGKTNTIQKIYTNGDDPADDWKTSDPFSSIGCDAMYSAVDTPLGIMYLSKAKGGIYVFNGQSSILKSESVTPVISDILSTNLGSVSGEYNNNVYYMAYASSAIGGSINNRVLVNDVLLNAFTIDTLAINTFCSLTGGSDAGNLIAGASDNGKVYQFASTNKQIIHTLHSDLLGTFTDSRYIPIEVGGDANSPIIEMSWDCTIDTWTADILAKDGTWDSTINDINTHLATAVIDRPDGTGNYISQVINTVGASAYDKIFWNEILAAGTDATFAIRHGTNPANCIAAGWSAEYSSAAGSDISGISLTGGDGEYTQYRISLTTADTDYSPYVTTSGGYTVKLTYSTVGTAAETGIALHWQTGWLDFDIPMYQKTLRKISVKHKGTLGIVTIKITNEFSEQDTFSIDLSVNPEKYEEYITGGGLTGTQFQIDISNNNLEPLIIKEISFDASIEPII